MRGLMSGRWKVPDQHISEISISLMAVVQNVLGHAWRVLLAEVADGKFSICNAHEDVITERLYMILGSLHASEPEAVKGFALFETPVREGNLRNQQGDRPDCQPDLTFRPLRGQISTKNSVTAGIFVECKPVDSQHPIGSAYCKEGISRFVKGDYAWAVDRALMLAYVRNICQLPEGLDYVLGMKSARVNYKLKKKLTPLGITGEGDEIYYTVHDRAPPASLPNNKTALIFLHHLWLNLDRPCETSRCRTKRRDD